MNVPVVVAAERELRHKSVVSADHVRRCNLLERSALHTVAQFGFMCRLYIQIILVQVFLVDVQLPVVDLPLEILLELVNLKFVFGWRSCHGRHSMQTI